MPVRNLETPMIDSVYYGSNTAVVGPTKWQEGTLTIGDNTAGLNAYMAKTGFDTGIACSPKIPIVNGEFDNLVEETYQEEEETPMKRIVQVFIADTDNNVPLDNSVIHTGEQQLTDLTDQELYYEINIKEKLDKHNEYRKTLIDKKASIRAGKDINLEPIKIRDLKMVVVTIAEF